MLKCFSLFCSILCFPAVTWVASPFSVDGLLFFTLPLTIVFPPEGSLRFLVLLNDNVEMFSNTFPIISFICKMDQYFYIIVDMFRAVWLYVIDSGMQFSFL